MVAVELQPMVSDYILQNRHLKDMQVANHFKISRQEIANFRYLKMKLVKSKKYHYKNKNDFEAKQFIGYVLETWVNSNYNTAETMAKTGVKNFQLSRWISTYYLSKKQSEQTEVLTLKSRV